MHSFQPSRGRIFFEVLCAVVVAASLGGAWIQTGASALLAAAAVATLYSLVHFFDLFRRQPGVAAEPQRIDFAPDGQADLVMDDEAPEPEEWAALPDLAIEPPRPADNVVEITGIVDAPAPKSGGARKGKTPRKSAGRPSAARKSKTADAECVDDSKVEGPSLAEVAAVAGTVILEPAAPVPQSPLFEPDPFARMPRQSFGRRGQL